MTRPDPAPPERKRLPAAERAELLKNLAAEAFSEHGFSITTRDIAERCGVTQALLYKYFGSKEKLVEAVLEKRFLAGRAPPDRTSLEGPGPLEVRIGAFYADFVERSSPVDARIFLRAALDGLDLPARYGARLDDHILRPVLDALCRELNQAPMPKGPLPKDARELAMMLHGSAVFTVIRQEIYRTQFHLSHAELVRRHVRIWLPGALEEMRRLAASGRLTAPGSP